LSFSTKPKNPLVGPVAVGSRILGCALDDKEVKEKERRSEWQ
jgi:hypothetical protein